MSNSLRIITSNIGDDAAITASPAVASALPASYLQINSRTKVMQTTGLADQDININWGGATVAISGCALTRHNLTADATWRLRLYDGQNQAGSIVYDSTAIQANPPKTLSELNWGVEGLGATQFTGWDSDNIFSNLWFTLVNALSAKITLSDSANPDGYMRAGRLYIGDYITAEFSADLGVSVKWVDTSEQFRTDAGTLRTDVKSTHRELPFNLSFIQPHERAKWLEAVRATGKRRDVFFSLHPEDGTTRERDNAMPCKLVNDPAQTLSDVNIYAMDFIYEEV